MATATKLSPRDATEAIQNFAEHMLSGQGTDSAAYDRIDAYMEGCRILYRDNHDTGCCEYQIVDAEGHGDGSGTWTPVA